MPPEELPPARRTDDMQIVRWKSWAWLLLVASVTFVVSQILDAHSALEVRAILVAFSGGIIAITVTGIPLAKGVVDNYQALATSRQERVDELHLELEEERAERRKDKDETERLSHQVISNLEARYQGQIDALRLDLAGLVTKYDDVNRANKVLQALLVEQQEKKGGGLAR